MRWVVLMIGNTYLSRICAYSYFDANHFRWYVVLDKLNDNGDLLLNVDLALSLPSLRCKIASFVDEVDNFLFGGVRSDKSLIREDRLVKILFKITPIYLQSNR